ncbi:MAG: hypothetical protein M3259_03410 [Actinomycetota bacterium]|nr:hypothetical protein [Actinomycetota bacterium]
MGQQGEGKEDTLTIQQDTPAENILDHLSDLKNYPDQALAPYEEFTLAAKTYECP